MIVSQLVGAVTVAILREELMPDAPGAQGTGRFALNLNPEQTAAVAHAVLSDPVLRDKIELKLPADYLDGYGLPDEALTSLPATYFRNAACSKAAFLLADVEHDESASFNEIARIGPAELFDRLDLWVRIVSSDLHLMDEQLRWWEKSLAGLRDLRLVSLDRFAIYILRIRDAIQIDGLPLLHALGAALPALRLPRDTFYFNGIKEKSRGFPSAWRAHYAAAQKRRAGLLLKQTSSQLLLSEDDLSVAFEKVRDVIPEVYHPAVVEFIVAPSGWNAPAATLAECEWEEIKPLFDGLSREKFNLGQATLDFYDEREPTLLSDDDREYLKLLIGRRTTEPGEDDVSFYEAHRTEVKDDRKLKSAWDRFVFGRPTESDDFIAGLSAALEPLFNRAPLGDNRKLRIRCERATKRDLREINVDAGVYFAHRYAGLKRLFGSKVSWDVGDLFEFTDLVDSWRSTGKGTLNRSVSKAALQLKFILELETETEAGDLQTCSAQVVWRYDANAVSSQLADDWSRLARHPFLACRASREFSSAKERARTVDLSNVRTFVPAYDRDRGSFVPIYKVDRDLGALWRANLSTCRSQRLLSDAAASNIEAAFAVFASAYETAIREFPKYGAGGSANIKQLTAFAELLEAVTTLAKGDRNRDLLLKPLLQIGVVPIEGGAPVAVVAPWHPMRLGAMWRKARLVADLLEHLLSTREVMFGDSRLFFRDLNHDLSHPLYPEAAVTWTADGPQLLTVSDFIQDYSLHEPPVALVEGSEDTNENPLEGSACVLDLVRRYLALHPHERTNMSVVLFNCDSARLPQAVVERIGSIQDDDEDVRCQVLLRHVDSRRLRDVYRSILSAETGADAYSASEATQDFMARLRIAVIADQAPPPDPKDGCPYDIVFSQDVISRHARVEWYSERAEPADFRTLLPSRWSRRRPAAADDLKSAVYLCCPVQSLEGWAYLTAVSTVFRGDRDGDGTHRLLPARQLDFRDGRTSRIFQETHDLGNWVVNFDELLDRRQLLNQEVRVIRYKQSATQGRNLIISSRAPLGLLRSMILHRLRSLGLDLTDAELRALADRLIEDANDVSGDIVLRAAKRGQSASELIGVVLSRWLVRNWLGWDSLVGWYFLDDYAAWIGQREEQLADLLAISPHITPDGKLRISMVVSEAKYIDLASLAVKRKESQKQLRDTLHRVEEAIFGNPERLDRQSWLARLADLMLDGIRVPAASGVDLGEWRRSMREGHCEINLVGFSHVFVPTATDGTEPTDISEVSGVSGAFQEVYGRSDLKRLLQAYWRDERTPNRRGFIGADHVSPVLTWRRPGSNEEVQSSAPIAPVTSQPASDEIPEISISSTPDVSQVVGERVIPEEDNLDLPVSGWAYPAISALALSSRTSDEEGFAEQEWLARISAATRSALQQLQLQAKLVDSALTPNSALLKFAGSANLTVEQVTRKRSEMLTTFGLNVISIRPEPGAVILAVERPARKVVSIETLWSKWKHNSEGWGNQDLLIGVRENDGTLLYLSPGRSHAPHTLIAGSTGSGKSVLMQNIILGIAATNTPEQARILLIDPKQGVDYFAFEDLPHLDTGIIDDQTVATQRLTELVTEMDQRYGRFKQARVSNLAAYNAKVTPSERLPAIWLIHDEFAEWMLTEDYKEAVASVVQRLGVKARAAGIYLVFAAQRPDAHVMPMQLRANLGNRLILRVDSEGTSEIALGEKGAERLLGRGHLLAKLEGERDLCFAQVPFVDPEFADSVVAATQRSIQNRRPSLATSSEA
jgi:S-DNA-T family DNA segregation ATPase FtsK/SpoIIIE